MDQASPKRSRRKYWLIAGLVLLVAAGAFFWLYQSRGVRGAVYQTTTAARGTLTASVSASGIVRASRSVELTWNASGRVGEVVVGLGGQVSPDQVLASLAEDSAPRSILLARADLVTARQNLDDLLQSGSSTAQAMQTLADAGQAVKDAQDAYDALTRKRVSAQLISDTSDQIEQAKKQLRFQEYIYNLFYAHRAEGSTDKALMIVQLTRAKQNIADLTARYNWYTSQASPIAIEQSLAALNLAKAKEEDARRELDRLKNGVNSDDLAAAKARVAAAQSIINQAAIIAPFAGTITRAQPQPGDRVSAGQLAFRVDDLSELMVDLQISEVDINSVSLGQPVSVSFDAVPGKQYKGLVSSVDQAAESGQGGINYKVSVTLTDPDEQVKPGMSAAVIITVKAVDNALLVPNRAVRMLNGQRIVYILKGDQPVPVNIRLGASADENSQVVGGDLKAGDQIILNPPSLPTPTPAPKQ